MPLALDADGHFDECRQRALVRYYVAAGAGGIAAAVHTTQFAIREPRHGLLRPVLELVADELQRCTAAEGRMLASVAGVCGHTKQATQEAAQAAELGYCAGLLNLAALRGEPMSAILDHCRAVAEHLPLFGFYLQAGVGGIELPYAFWRAFADIENVVAIKIATFDRYRTLDVVRAISESGRNDIALYTGNDDDIVTDLLTPYTFDVGGRTVERRIVGGLLGHWAVWTQAAVRTFERCRQAVHDGGSVSAELLSLSVRVTDCNAAVFDAANGFRGCIPGVNEVMRRQGLLATNRCLDPHERLSPGQAGELDRVSAAYPDQIDDDFVRQHLDAWLRP
jgi:dihydrodipicolinate synthase/N-acetylneuraminate lyase